LKPNAFNYVRAKSLDDIFSVFSEHGDEAKILAGGQSLIPTMNMRFAAPDVLIDVSDVDEMKGIQVIDNSLRIGAMSRHVDVLNSADVAEHSPLISMAMPNIAHATIRNRGTFGGSLCHADPASELPACTLALDAKFNIASATGSRTVAAADFIEGTYTTCMSENEVLVSVDVPSSTSDTVAFFDEIARRKGDYAMAGLAAKATVSDGKIANPRLVYFAVGDVALSSPSAEKILSGATITDIDTDAVCDAIASDIEPFDDLTTSGPAKLAMMKVLTRRALNAFSGNGGGS
jgi:carbon-monoxide dehydrogenase medium subunit